MDQPIEALTGVFMAVVEFLIAYGFQILGALLFLAIGLKMAGWASRRVARAAEAKNIDPTLGKFIGNVTKLVVVGFVAVITLGNFGITIAPLIALAGASAFGATLAIQGPLSNYGAGLSIILSRPFVVGNTITVKDVSGVVEEITLAATVLVGEDGERIRVPNKEIVGEVITNSDRQRVVQTKICIGYDQDSDRAVTVLRGTVAEFPDLPSGSKQQVGIHDFTYGGIVLGVRFWVPSSKYYQTRYAVNQALLAALNKAGIKLLPAGGTAIVATSLSADSEGGAIS